MPMTPTVSGARARSCTHAGRTAWTRRARARSLPRCAPRRPMPRPSRGSSSGACCARATMRDCTRARRPRRQGCPLRTARATRASVPAPPCCWRPLCASLLPDRPCGECAPAPDDPAARGTHAARAMPVHARQEQRCGSGRDGRDRRCRSDAGPATLAAAGGRSGGGWLVAEPGAVIISSSAPAAYSDKYRDIGLFGVLAGHSRPRHRRPLTTSRLR